ncbi:acetyltransferase (GNAT) family protein [Oxobacter pfennigii]|uniref:Acetyltransferase (GNAT) family protein n=1 Tax=Oxobacter pfennigii TaxID=36849 RepID=A0A0P8WL96_9CLOT|nr:GNAT family N-acetyltransferase [Oxobacter pfennigii]KPU43162.1 acetyltransferase (GNAT) family protein [Oxobacter pfennigii]
MIRKLTIQDNKKVMEYLKEEASINLFIMGDIENYGYDKTYLDLWGEFDEGGNLKAVMMKFFNSLTAYSKGCFDVQEFAGIIKGLEGIEEFSGKASVTEKFENIQGFNLKGKRNTFLCELKGGNKLSSFPEEYKVKKAGIEDADRLVESMAVIEEFGPITQADKKRIKNKLEVKTGRAFFIEEDGIIVSAANTTAENSKSAMIVGVYTHPDYRSKGYATLCMNVLCRELLSEGKSLCLFYDNPAAGRIYKRLGFTDIGNWNMYEIGQ